MKWKWQWILANVSATSFVNVIMDKKIDRHVSRDTYTSGSNGRRGLNDVWCDDWLVRDLDLVWGC